MFYDYNEGTVWDDEELLDRYAIEVVEPTILHGWAAEEIQYGATVREMEDRIWEDYEQWAYKQIDEREEELIAQYMY